MEALSSINSNAEIKQPKAIVIEQSNKEVCKNRIEMPFDDLLKITIKKDHSLCSKIVVLWRINISRNFMLCSTMEKSFQELMLLYMSGKEQTVMLGLLK